MDTNAYSSPACYAHEFAPGHDRKPPMAAEEIVRLLNTLLEAERAGARVLAAFLNDYERDTPAWRQLAAVQRDEARNCTVLMGLIERLNGTPSAATGKFLGKALALDDRIARLRFLNRGQEWVARKIREALPRVEQDFAYLALFAMEESHLLNIELCDALIEALQEKHELEMASRLKKAARIAFHHMGED
jgi:nitronate monooxygenase